MTSYDIAVILPKGGVGKTFLSHAIAAAAADMDDGFDDIAIIDHDDQGSSKRWAELAEEAGTPLPYDVLVVDHDLTRWMRRTRDDYDMRVMDGHPKDDEQNRAAARNAHTVVIPTHPYLVDLDRLYPWLEFCDKLRVPVTVVLTMVSPWGADADIARDTLTKRGVHVARTEYGWSPVQTRTYGSPPNRDLINLGYELLDEITPA